MRSKKKESLVSENVPIFFSVGRQAVANNFYIGNA